MQPSVYELALSKLSTGCSLDAYEQARVLRPLFVNQGFYNSFIAAGAASGLVLWRRSRSEAGRALIQYACGSALAAGLVLARSTSAYLGALLQAAPAAVALILLR